MAEYHFGEVPGEPVGTVYADRVAAKDARVHQVTQQGIAGNRKVGCASIVLSGGYDTDEDYGHEIFYTGRGGQDPKNPRGPHISDQDITISDNAALVRSEETGLPIRIVRGSGHGGDHAPEAGYRYDGLYRVVKHYPHKHLEDGYIRWMFHLVQLTPDEAAEYTPPENVESNAHTYVESDLGSGPVGGAADVPRAEGEPRSVDPYFDRPIEFVIPPGKTDPGSKTVISQRVIRDTKITATVKAMYANTCQVCGTQLVTKHGLYSEGAHIRPLGKPHHGPDTMANIVCLCPNHHAAFDKGGIYIDDELRARDTGGGVIGILTLHADHKIDVNNIRYHRAHHGHDLLHPGAV
jgi:putative restriction endonuclease